MKKAVKTESRYYIFIEYCNGSDLKELMELRDWEINPEVVQKILYMLVNGVYDMMQMLVIHRDLKLQNIMVHFPNDSLKLLAMTKQMRKEWLRTVDLSTTPFEVKIADFGFSKKLRNKS